MLVSRKHAETPFDVLPPTFVLERSADCLRDESAATASPETFV
jgi:hypothetical protein